MTHAFRDLAEQLLSDYQWDDDYTISPIDSLASAIQEAVNFWFTANRDDLRKKEQPANPSSAQKS
jgi:hypothetical protein